MNLKRETRIVVMTPEDSELYGFIIKSQSQPMTIFDPQICFDLLCAEAPQAEEIVFWGDKTDPVLKRESGIAGFELKASSFFPNVVPRWH